MNLERFYRALSILLDGPDLNRQIWLRLKEVPGFEEHLRTNHRDFYEDMKFFGVID